jgi:hypothetical protein
MSDFWRTTQSWGKTLGKVRSDPYLNIFEISGHAWAMTVRKAAASLAAEPGGDISNPPELRASPAIEEMSPEETRTAEAELARAGIVDSAGNISAQWVLAAWILAYAPIKVAMVAQTAAESSHCELGLAGGRGIALNYRRRLSRAGHRIDVAEIKNVVEVSFFREEHAWAATTRNLPNLPELRANAVNGSAFDGQRTTVPFEALRAWSSGGVPDGLPSEIINARCTTHLQVAARWEGSGSDPAPRTSVTTDVWALGERLYSLRTAAEPRNLSAVDVPPGDISREFAWRLLGAREFLAGSSAQAA